MSQLDSITVGIILFVDTGKEYEFLVMHHGGTYWNFPKGRMEKNENDELQTAYREIYEETGIGKDMIEMIPDFRKEYIYSFESEYKENFGKIVRKKAVFYLARSKTKKITISDEHASFGWFGYDEALKKLGFSQSCDVLKSAHSFLLKNEKSLV